MSESLKDLDLPDDLVRSRRIEKTFDPVATEAQQARLSSDSAIREEIGNRAGWCECRRAACERPPDRGGTGDAGVFDAGR